MMKRQGHGRPIAAMVVLAMSLAAAERCAAGEVRLWPTATVQGESIRLVEVADLRDFDPDVQESLGELSLRPAPAPGGEVLVTAAEVRQALSDGAANLASLRLFGASRCRVSRPRVPRETVTPLCAVASEPSPARTTTSPTVQPKSPARRTIEALVVEYLTARSPDPKARLEVRFSSAGRRFLDAPAEGRAVKIRPTNDRRLGMISLEVEVMVADGPPQVEAVLAEVQLVREVVVARRPINKGKNIEARDLQLEERRFTDLADLGLTDLSAAVGQQSGDFVRLGEMLRAEGLASRPVVNRGDTVTIWARLGGVEVKTTGKAQQAGALGDVIPVRRDGAKRKQDLLDAVVTGPKTVAMRDARQVAAGGNAEVRSCE